MYVLLFLVSLLCIVSCEGAPRISSISEEVVANIGDNVSLDCTAEDLGKYPLIWFKARPDKSWMFLSSGNAVLIRDPRISVRRSGSSPIHTLQISNLQETDSGLYRCGIVLSPTSHVTAAVWVHVRVSPNFSENSTTSVITTTGASATLECYADGYPQPRISWRRQNNDLLPTGEIIYQGNVLNISNVTKNDRGIYFCVANNRVSRKARKIPVDVEYAPLVTIERPRQDHVLRNRVDLRCKVEAFPQPSTIWLKDGYAIKDNQLFTISIFSTADDQVDTTLRILATEKKRYGNYTCKATNKLGSAESTVELYDPCAEDYIASFKGSPLPEELAFCRDINPTALLSAVKPHPVHKHFEPIHTYPSAETCCTGKQEATPHINAAQKDPKVQAMQQELDLKREELAMRMNLLREEHSLRMEEHNLRLQQHREKHAIEMELLQEQKQANLAKCSLQGEKN